MFIWTPDIQPGNLEEFSRNRDVVRNKYVSCSLSEKNKCHPGGWDLWVFFLFFKYYLDLSLWFYQFDKMEVKRKGGREGGRGGSQPDGSKQKSHRWTGSQVILMDNLECFFGGKRNSHGKPRNGHGKVMGKYFVKSVGTLSSSWYEGQNMVGLLYRQIQNT